MGFDGLEFVLSKTLDFSKPFRIVLNFETGICYLEKYIWLVKFVIISTYQHLGLAFLFLPVTTPAPTITHLTHVYPHAPPTFRRLLLLPPIRPQTPYPNSIDCSTAFFVCSFNG